MEIPYHHDFANTGGIRIHPIANAIAQMYVRKIGRPIYQGSACCRGKGRSTKGVLVVEAKGDNGGLDLTSVPEVKGRQIRSVGGCGGSHARGNPDTTLSGWIWN
jgi:hypothetical protein